ncbi:hypothetical protein ZWY2020_048258, partial [Hordeum vulgare]
MRIGMREWPLPRMYELLHGEERERWPPEARFPEASHNGDVSEIKKIAKELDVKGNGIRKTVANTTYMGMNVLHAAGGGGRLPIYRYLVEVVKMDVDTPDTARGNNFLHQCHMPSCMGTFPLSGTFLDHGTDLHQQREKITLLHMAVVHVSFEGVSHEFNFSKFGRQPHEKESSGRDEIIALASIAVPPTDPLEKYLLEHENDICITRISGPLQTIPPLDKVLTSHLHKGLSQALVLILFISKLVNQFSSMRIPRAFVSPFESSSNQKIDRLPLLLSTQSICDLRNKKRLFDIISLDEWRAQAYENAKLFKEKHSPNYYMLRSRWAFTQFSEARKIPGKIYKKS